MVIATEKIELVRRAMQDVYHNPSVAESYTCLFDLISDWEASPPDQEEARRIFDGLQSLHGFLLKKELNEEASELLLYTLAQFPEFCFPAPPKVEVADEVDFSLFQEARQIFPAKTLPEKIYRALNNFEDQLRKADLQISAFCREIEAGEFSPAGKGRAGELFRGLKDFLGVMQDTPGRDIPWQLINQLAVRMNNEFYEFEQAYNLLKALEAIKTARPSGWIRDEITRNEKHFYRNLCWRNIDDAILANDTPKVNSWVDKALTFTDEEFEHKYLLMLRRTPEKNDRNASSQIYIGLLVGCVLGITAIVLVILEPLERRSLNLDEVRKDLMQSIRLGGKDGDSSLAKFASRLFPVSVTSHTGLAESRPPFNPHGRKLELAEVRHAVFQKYRLDYLNEQALSTSERDKYNLLEKDWKESSEFYDYHQEDREKVDADLKIHGPNLVLDAQDIMKSWRDEDEVIKKVLSSKVALDPNNALHLAIILRRLQTLGFLKTPEPPKIWDENCNRALMEFKAAHLSIVDSVWDRKTQEALFSN